MGTIADDSVAHMFLGVEFSGPLISGDQSVHNTLVFLKNDHMTDLPVGLFDLSLE